MDSSSGSCGWALKDLSPVSSVYYALQPTASVIMVIHVIFGSISCKILNRLSVQYPLPLKFSPANGLVALYVVQYYLS